MAAPVKKKPTTKATKPAAKPTVKTASAMVKKQVNNSDQLDMLKMIAGDIKGNMTFEEKEEIKFIPANLLSYNRASVFGGYPTGGIYELHGPNGGGKTALGIEILSSAQKAGHLTVMYDHERAANDKSWIENLGLDLKNCLYRNKALDGKSIMTLEESAQEINDMIINFNEKKQKKLIPQHVLLYILFDSVASAVPKAKLEKGAKVGDANYGLTARLMSDWLQTLNALVGGSDVAVIFINQERVNVGAKPWEQKFKSFGGEALQFYASVRIRVNYSGATKEKVNSVEIQVGKEHKFKLEKNKLGYPMQEGYFYTSNGLGECNIGFDDVRATITEAILQNLITKEGTRFNCEFFDEINGEKKLRAYLRNNPDTLEKIKEKGYNQIVEGKINMTDTKSGDDDITSDDEE
ncbi:MAG: recA protein [Sedimentibacter sp.]|jgi:recombination protein RecA|nr:recA protein [Sedimentibacter sp.]